MILNMIEIKHQYFHEHLETTTSNLKILADSPKDPSAWKIHLAGKTLFRSSKGIN